MLEYRGSGGILMKESLLVVGGPWVLRLFFLIAGYGVAILSHFRNTKQGRCVETRESLYDRLTPCSCLNLPSAEL
jgi:hypothetical protein